mgnify:CR=1 FL=1
MERLSIHESKYYNLKYFLLTTFLIVLFLFSGWFLNLDFTKFITRLGNIETVISNFMSFDVNMLPEALEQLLVSICLGVAGLIISTILSFFIAALSANNTTFNPLLSSFLKGAIAVIRAVPSLVWILMVVASIGFGNNGALLGIVIMTTGFLSKAFIEAFESNGTARVEALRSTGARWINIVIQGVANDALPSLLTWITISLETCIATSISLGVLGISGIGALLNKQIMKFNYSGISTIIVIIFVTMIVVEMVTLKIKEGLHAK